MTSFERYQNILDGKNSDILPRLPILMQFAAEYIGSNYGQFASDFQTLVKANIECAKDFEFDQLSTISDSYRETAGFGADIEFIKDGVPKCIKPPLEESKNISSLLTPSPLKSTRMLDRIKAIDSYKKRFGNSYSILGWIEGPAAEAADLRGVSAFLLDLLDDGPFITDLMDLCVDVAIKFGSAQIRAGADTIGMGDAIASQISPALYERLVQPRQKKIIKALQSQGAWVRLHICGNIAHLLPGIADLGVDILDVDHMVDIVKVRQAVGDNTVLAGNIDPVSGVKNGTPENIRATILDTYSKVGNPYMPTAGCEIPTGTPFENLKALCGSIKYQNIFFQRREQ
jgi:MtaA/CmuA family methyltransferase